MSGLYPIEPVGGWRLGDRAYCLYGARINGRQVLEKGRIYHLDAVLHVRGLLHSGLRLTGVDRVRRDGFLSNRFVCLRNRGDSLRQINNLTTGKSHDAYIASNTNKKELELANRDGKSPEDDAKNG